MISNDLPFGTEYIQQRRALAMYRLGTLGLSNLKKLRSLHQNVTRLDIDNCNSRYLLSSGGDGSISLYDLEIYSKKNENNFKLISYAKRTSNLDAGHSRLISSLEWFPWDTGAFMTSSMDGYVHVWDTNTFKPVVTFGLNSDVYSATTRCLSNNLIATGTLKNGIKLCDLESGLSVHTLSGHSGLVMSVAWSPSEEYILASGGADGNVKLWDVRYAGHNSSILSFDWREDHTAFDNADPYDRHIDRVNDQVARAHESKVTSIAFSSCGRQLISCSNDGNVRVWDTATGKIYPHNMVCPQGSNLPFQTRVISPDPQSINTTDDLFLLPSTSESLCLWQIHSDMIMPYHVLQGHMHPINAVAYRPRENQILTGGQDGMIFLWDKEEKRKNVIDPGSTLDASSNVNGNGNGNGNGDDWSSDSDSDDEGKRDNGYGNGDGNGNTRGRGRGRGRGKRRFVPPIIRQAIEQTLANVHNSPEESADLGDISGDSNLDDNSGRLISLRAPPLLSSVNSRSSRANILFSHSGLQSSHSQPQAPSTPLTENGDLGGGGFLSGDLEIQTNLQSSSSMLRPGQEPGRVHSNSRLKKQKQKPSVRQMMSSQFKRGRLRK